LRLQKLFIYFYTLLFGFSYQQKACKYTSNGLINKYFICFLSLLNEYVSKVAAHEAVRSFLSKQQKALGVDKGIVMDGRDIGTVVFPLAECKFFLTATPEVRAKRRHQEQLQAGLQESYDEVLSSVKDRDSQDTSRAFAPLLKAEDAVEIDVSELTIEQVYEQLYAQVLKRIH
jgi:cytidylate kinase